MPDTDTPSAEALAAALDAHNRWRRGDDEPAPNPTELGKTIDAAATMLRSLASERDALRATLAASCDEERSQLWEAGPGGGCSRALDAERERDALRAALDAAQAPREVPRLTGEAINKLGETLGERVPGHADYLSWGQGYRADESGRHTIPNLPANLIPFARAVESRVRELCGVAP